MIIQTTKILINESEDYNHRQGCYEFKSEILNLIYPSIQNQRNESMDGIDKSWVLNPQQTIEMNQWTV